MGDTWQVMSYNISEGSYEKHTGEDSGTDSLNFTPEKHYVAAADAPKGGDPTGAKDAAREIREADPEEAASARRGASMATQNGTIKGESLAFKVSDGMHSIGADHSTCFEQAVRDSGGVRQGSAWCSDAAPGVARITCEHTLTLEQLAKPDEHKGLQDQGSGRTFEAQRHSNWSHDRWGG